MFYVLQNESTAALRRVPILLTDAATGTTAQTGVATTNIFPYVNINGGAFAGGAGTVGEAGYGQYYYEMDSTEIGVLGLAGVHITAVGCRDYDAIAQIAAFNVYSAATGISASDVWTYDYITPGVVAQSAAERLEDTRTNTYTIDGNTSNIASSVWNRDPISVGDNTTGDYYSAYLYQLGIGATGYAGTSITAGDVWSYAGGRTITGGIADTVTDVTNGVIVTTNNDKTGYALSGTQSFNLTGNITGNLSGSVGSVTSDVNVSTASMSGIANTVWSTLTAPYTTHATFGHQILRSDNAATIGEVTLHQSGGSKRVDADVHAFVNNTASATAMLNILTGIGASMTTNITGNITGNLSGSVGSVTSDVNVSTASMTGIAGTVWNTDVSAFTSPSAGYDLTQAALGGGGVTAGDVWSYATRTITGGIADTVTDVTNGVIVTTNNDKTGYALSSTQTFDLTGNITGNLTGSVGSVTADVNVSTGSMTGIAGTVWSTDVSGYVSPSAGYDLSNASSGSGLTAGDVWSYASREITGGIADTVTTVTNGVTVTTNNDKTGYALSSTQTFDLTGNITGNVSGSVGSVSGNVGGNVVGSVGSVTADVNVSTASMTGIAGTVWNYATRTLTSATGISAYDVWNFDPTSMTSPQAGAILTDIATDTNTIITDISNVPNNVWSSDISGYVTPGEAGYELSQASSGAGLTSGDIWSYATRTITGGIADTVTTLTNGVTVTTNNDKTGYSLSGTQSFNLTGNITGSVSGSVGSVTGSVGSVVSAVSLSTATQASIANSVWLTDVTSYAAPSAGEDLATAAVGGISPADVWTYATRTITGGIADTVTTLTNKSGFAITGGTIDVVNDKTGYSLSGSQTFNVTGNITGNVTGSVGSVSGAVGSVAGNVAGNVTGSVGSVTNPVSVATASMTGIAGTVWSYGTRTLTSGGGITAGDVWTYDISGITTSGSAGNALNDAAVSGSVVTIVNGPYRLNSTAEGTDGRIDILQGSVQTINLNLVNGFDQPFNVTGYTLSVDVYDVSSALVESYVPTVNFASGGNISFDIDGTVTDIIGTYTIVVSLTNGDVIQVGPITILVRPL